MTTPDKCPFEVGDRVRYKYGSFGGVDTGTVVEINRLGFVYTHDSPKIIGHAWERGIVYESTVFPDGWYLYEKIEESCPFKVGDFIKMKNPIAKVVRIQKDDLLEYEYLEDAHNNNELGWVYWNNLDKYEKCNEPGTS